MRVTNSAVSGRGHLFFLLVGVFLTVAAATGLVVKAMEEPRAGFVVASNGHSNLKPEAVLAPPLALVVNNTGDAADSNVGDGLCDTDPAPGDQCTFRAAIQEANLAAGADTISFNVPNGSTITLNSALPDIVSDVTITGPGDSQLTITRNAAAANFRILTLSGTSSITGITITNGRAANGSSGTTGTNGASGGAIFNSGTLTIRSVTLSGNRAGNGGDGSTQGGNGGSGGAVHNTNVLNVIDCRINGNFSGVGGNGPTPGQGGVGGGIYSPSGTTNLHQVFISGNTANVGGGIYNFGELRINLSQITGNTASSGAGIFNGSNLTLYNGTVASNTASNVGGGILTPGTALLANATVSSNTAAAGAGIENSGTLTLKNATIASNAASAIAGGLENVGGVVNFTNTIISQNTAPTGPNGSGTVNSQDFNLIGNTSNLTITGTTTHDLNNVNALLGPLSANASTLLTHALLPGSPALDAGSSANLPTDFFDMDNDSNTGELIPTDERGIGFNRIVDAADPDTVANVDIGAYEAQVSVPDILNKTVNEDGSLSFSIDIGGGAQVDSVLAASSDTTVVPNLPANLSLTGSGSTRTITINPSANKFGTTNIAIAVASATESVLDTFQLTVNPVVDTPSITAASTSEDTQTTSGLVITRNAVDGAEVSHFKITGLSNGTLFLNNGTTPITNNSFITFAQGNAGLRFTPAANSTANGSFNIQGATSNSDAALSGPTVGATITVTAVNDAPVNNVPGAQTVAQNGSLTFTAGNLISIADIDAGANGVRTTLTASNGTISLSGTAGLSFSTGDGTADQIMTFSGTVAAINVALNGMSFVPTNGFSGAASLQISTNDQGNSGSGGALVDTDSISINVTTSAALIKFSAATFNTTENAGVTTITVERSGTTNTPVTVQYETADHSESLGVFPCATVNGIASSRCDYTTAVGKLSFAAGETSKTFQVLISQDAYVEGPEGISLTLSNPAGGAQLVAPSTAMLIIADDATEPTTNPVEDPATFVKQHYHDFLNREPDAAGLNFWVQEITVCGADPQCLEVKRINVSAAFFLSTEFQETGVLVFRAYKAAYGNQPGAPVPVRFNEYLPDAQQVGQGVQVGIGNWEAQLEANKTSYLTDFVTRTRFTNAFPTSLTPTQFVDQLFLNTGITPTSAERQAAINEFGGAGTSADTSARVRALRRVVENDVFKTAETNRAFVLMQYFGYMRRNPDVTPDLDYSGYTFWLTKLINFNGNFVNAEMVKAFIISSEYRARFGSQP